MSTIVDLAARLAANPQISDAELEEMIALSDAANAKAFLSVEGAKDAVKLVTRLFVEKYMNNPDTAAVPLRKKTKFLLVLNNFVLQKNLRNAVMQNVQEMDSIFEESMKKEGTMPFDSELGRMSEHVLVLLMRGTGYKLKAAQVHEFAENNTQFAVQLLLAILLKEPPYEFDLRCNCISGILGFTQPQAFFQASSPIEFQSCTKFSDKVDFICNLMLRLNAVQVVNDVLAPQLVEFPAVQPQVHFAVVHMMRCIMNIFQFVSTNSTQWRQHVLLSTTFVDSVAVLYLQAQLRALNNIMSVSQHTPSIPADLLGGIRLALKFMAFATFHMGRHGKSMRPLCTFIHDMLSLNVRGCVADAKLGGSFCAMFTQLLHFISNIDALEGDSGVAEDVGDLVPELKSAALQQRLISFVQEQLGGNAAVLEQWHKSFYAVEADSLVSQDCRSFQIIDETFVAAKKSAAPATAPPTTASKKSLLGDMPALGKPKAAEKQAVTEAVSIQQAFVAPSKQSSASTTNKYACALNGHTMKVPVISPYGHTFEKDTIEQWIKQQGTVCPLTGKPLSLSDLQPNKELQNEIMQAVIKQTMMARNDEDDVDLYDF